MKNKKISNISIIILLLIIIVFCICIITKDNLKKAEKEKKVETNYWLNESGDKVNTSKFIDEIKKIEDLSIEKSEITRKDGISTLTAKVINKGLNKENLRLKVKFIDNDSNLMTEVMVLVGDIKSNETSYINAGFPDDVSNAKNIEYSIVE